MSIVTTKINSVIDRLDRATAPLRGEGRGWFVLFVAIGWFLTLGARYLIPAVLPAIKADFGVSNSAAGLVVSVIWLTYGFLQYPAGALTDRLGERRLLTASAVLAAVSLVGFAVIPSYFLFLIAAAAFGTGTGLFGPARGLALSKTYDEHEGSAFGVVLAAGSIGAAVLPFTATLLTTEYGWRLAVAVFFPAFVAVAVGLWWAVPSDLGGSRNDSSIFAGLYTTVRCLGTPRVALSVGAIVIMLFVMQGLTAFFTTYLTSVKGLSSGIAGALFALLFVSGSGFQIWTGRLADEYGHRLVMVAVSAISVLPLVMFPFVEGLGLLALVTAGIGIRLALGPLTNAYIIGSLPDDGQGAVWGSIRTLFFAIGSSGSYVIGIMGDYDMFDEAMFLLAGLTALGTALYWMLPED
ncbi:MAG: MFS transporter [Halodesulfurarchaeum sp.]